MKNILYLTDPEVSSEPQINDLADFLAQQSRKHNLDLIVVGGDLVNMHDLAEHHRYQQILERVLDERLALNILEEEKKRMEGIRYFRPELPIPQPWFSLGQIDQLYSTLIQKIEKNTSAEIVLCAGNQDMRSLDDVINNISKGRTHHPEFSLKEIAGLKIGTISGSAEPVPFVDPRKTYCWYKDMNPEFRRLIDLTLSQGGLDILLSHAPPKTSRNDHIFGRGVDQIGNWDNLQRFGKLDLSGKNVGYSIIREIGEILKPPLWFVGHIHEARHNLGERIYPGAIDVIGESVVINPGAFYQNFFSRPSVALVQYEDKKIVSLSLLNHDEWLKINVKQKRETVAFPKTYPLDLSVANCSGPSYTNKDITAIDATNIDPKDFRLADCIGHCDPNIEFVTKLNQQNTDPFVREYGFRPSCYLGRSTAGEFTQTRYEEEVLQQL